MQCGYSPRTVMERRLHNVQGSGVPIAYPSKPDHKFGVIATYVCHIGPYLGQLRRERLGTHVGKLSVYRVVNRFRSTQEPIADPLVLDVRSHAIVGRGCNDPVKCAFF